MDDGFEVSRRSVRERKQAKHFGHAEPSDELKEHISLLQSAQVSNSLAYSSTSVGVVKLTFFRSRLRCREMCTGKAMKQVRSQALS